MDYSESSPQPEPEPTQEFVSARARRRRAQRRAYFPTDEEGRAALFTHLARRAYPSYELFVFSLVSGAILGLGYFLDSEALLIFGILVAPLMMPWIGISLATIAGALRFFLQTLIAVFISCLIIFLSGWLAGFASRAAAPRVFNEAFIHSRLWWPDIVVLTVGAIILTFSFVRSEQRPYLPSALLTYGLFLPLSAAGFGLGSGVGPSEIWPQALYVFLVHFSWATLFCLLSLFFLRFYPTSAGGVIFTGLVFVLLIAVVVSLTGFGLWAMERTGLATPVPASVAAAIPSPKASVTITLAPTRNATKAVSPAASTPSRTSNPATDTSEATLAPTKTSTATVTAEPTPIIAIIRAAEGGGAFIREKPGGLVLKTLGNGAIVTIIPNDFQEVNNVIWVHVFAMVNDQRVDGWMIQSLLQTATPVANWGPTLTPEVTQAP
jgi:uncharacterized protein DUF389